MTFVLIRVDLLYKDVKISAQCKSIHLSYLLSLCIDDSYSAIFIFIGTVSICSECCFYCTIDIVLLVSSPFPAEYLYLDILLELQRTDFFPTSLLFVCLQAANYLNIKTLLDLTCQTVADMIKGKTPEEIRKTFNIKNDFTPEEEEEVRRENQWAFE